MKKKAESGIALATTLIVLFLVVGLVVGFSWMVLMDQKLGGINGDQQYAFYGAEAGLEKLTSNLGYLFSTNPSPTAAQVHTIDIAANVPQIPGIEYLNPDGTLGYEITFPQDKNGNPLAQTHPILSGQFQNMTGLLTPFTLTTTARNTASGAEVKLQRNVQTVAIPVFQFGMFSQTDLSFFAGADFNFGGRVHTNGNLFLAEGDGVNLVFGDKVTAAGDIVRQQLSNGWVTSTGYTGNVYVPTTAGGCPPAPGGTTASCWQLQQNEGSVVAGVGSAATANWSAITARYHGYLQSQIQPLNLAITLGNNTNPIDLIRRGLPGEDASNPTTLAQRYYSEASVRILLSDNVLDITGLPCEDTSVAPTSLAALAAAQASPYTATGGAPIATSGAASSVITGNYNATDGYWTPSKNTSGKPNSLLTGFIKIEIQTSYAVPPAPCGTWKDVTKQVLALGIAGSNLSPSKSYLNYGNKLLTPISGGAVCTNPNSGAIIRLERLRDNPSTAANGNQWCGGVSTVSTDYWPNALFDTREGNPRDTIPASGLVALGGVMDYVELDIANLANYLKNDPVGQLAKDPNNSSYDFVVYFSDRRGNYTSTPIAGWPPASPSGNETGEYGFEDLLNPLSPNACPNNVLDTGETLDMVENPAQTVGSAPENYGAAPSPAVVASIFSNVHGTALTANPNCTGPSNSPNFWPGMYINNYQQARENSTLFFRRALKIVNGSSINLGTCPDGVACGLTIASENPVYVQGDFNNAGAPTDFSGAHVATSIVADAVTVLSDSWTDVNSFTSPYNSTGRAASTTTYRFGVVAGKGIAFPQPGYGSYQDFGTDGGVHNFLRYLESWSGQKIWYKGSVVSFYYNRQATGVYKDGLNNTVYVPSNRGYNFDSEFLTPSLLPPRTPLFRDVNTIGFTQTVLPTN